MARIRSVHPGLFTDEAYMSLSMAGKAALPGIWTECDDQGVFEWKPLVLKARIFPVDPVDMGQLLAELTSAGIVHPYEIDGRSYGVVRNFRKWQRPEKPKNRYPLPDALRPYAGLSSSDHQPVADTSPNGSRKSPQREEEGGRRLDGGDNLSLARENARAPEPKADVREGDPPHWATVQTLLKRPDDLDQWETDFLHSVKWAQTLTKPQREKLDTITARLASAPSPDATPTPPKPRVLVFVDTDQWKAWRDHLLGQGKRAPNPLDLKDEHHRLIGRGWYFDSEWPPPASDAAA